MAAPDPEAKRGYAAFLRGPVGLNTFAFGTVSAYRSGVQHEARLAVFPEPVDAELDDFGILAPGGFTVEIADEEGLSEWPILDELGEIVLDEAGSYVVEEY
jgi:hypothetical protein